jgi:hypothetical protein
MHIFKRVLFFLALWLVLESAISWGAFCQHPTDGSAASAKYHCVFKGPLFSIGRNIVDLWRHIFHEADAYVALFTAFLFVSTTALWWSTRQLWAATKVASEHIPRVERAYIYGGFGRRQLLLNSNGGFDVLSRVTMANYGRTPGFIRYIEVGWCKLSELPDRPTYTDIFQISDLYFPGMTMNDVRFTRAAVTIPCDGQHAVFQRVHYTDVLGFNRYSGSIYLLFLDLDDKTGLLYANDEPVRPDSPYWDRD